MLGWTYNSYSQVADEQQKKKVLDIYIGNFKTYTRYSRVVDEKKVLGGDCIFNLSQRGRFEKSVFGKPCLDVKFQILN